MTNRRSFLAAVSAAFAGSVLAKANCGVDSVRWDLLTTSEPVRFDLSTPWVCGERTVATDGRLLLAADGFGEAAGDSATRRPNLEILPWARLRGRAWQPGSVLERDLRPQCHVRCEECMGTGRLGPDVVRVAEICEDMIGLQDAWHGGEPCSHCGGEGLLLKGLAAWCDGAAFDRGYIRRIATMGDFEFCIEPWVAPGGAAMQLLLFRNAYGQGFLTSLRT